MFIVKGKKEKQMDRKTEIIIEANRLFFLKDYEKVSLNEIAKNLGITKGGIYHYFESKQTLLAEVMRFNFSLIEKIAFQNINESTTAYEAIRSFFGIRQMTERMDMLTTEETGLPLMTGDIEKFYYFIFNLTLKNKNLKEEVSQIYQRSVDLLAAIMKRGQRNGEVKESLEADIIALQFVALLEGIMLFNAFQVGNLDQNLEVLIEQLWKQIKK